MNEKGTRHNGSPEPSESWLETMRRIADSVLADEQVNRALATTKQFASAGGKAVASGLDKARDQFTQEEAWRQVESTLRDLVNVVRVQHAKIQQLTDRIDSLEGLGRP